jgi:hypothetical protein
MAKTVKVEALEYHTLNGKEYEAGDTYSAPSELIDTLVVQRKAKLVDEKDQGKDFSTDAADPKEAPAPKKAEKAEEPAKKADDPAKKSTHVEPMKLERKDVEAKKR